MDDITQIHLVMVLQEVPIHACDEYVGMHLGITFQRLYTFKFILYVYNVICFRGHLFDPLIPRYTYSMDLKVYNLWNVMHKCIPTYSQA